MPWVGLQSVTDGVAFPARVHTNLVFVLSSTSLVPKLFVSYNYINDGLF